MAADKPFRVTASPAPPAQQPNALGPTSVELEAASSGRALRPLQDVLDERRVRGGGKPLPWGEILSKLPAKIDGR